MKNTQRAARLRAGLMSIVLLGAAGLAGEATAQLDSTGGGRGNRIEGKTKFLPLPYLDYSRSLGGAIGAIPMLMFNPVDKDKVSPSSIVGAFGMYTENDTWLGLGFTKLFFKEDTWRITAAGGTGSVNFQFFLKDPLPIEVPYNTAADFALARLERRIWSDLFLGVSYTYTKYDTTTDEVPGTLTNTLHGLGANASFDRRSSVWYPRSGFYTEAKYRTYPGGLGNEFESDVLELEYNHYLPFTEDRDVLALRAYVGAGLGDLTFNQQFIVSGSDIRGYTQGEYRGNSMLAAQAEYRWNLWGRFGLVGFAGVATVFESFNEDDNGKLLPGVGAGFRFTAEKRTNMNIGLDVAAGNGDWGIYFRLGEAF